MAINPILKRIVEAPSISGFEADVRNIMKSELKGHVDGMKVDKVGNLITWKGKGNPKIMLAAHMDVLGLMVRFIEKEGFIRFESVGGWDERILPGMKVRIQGSNGVVTGVIGSKAVHIQEKDEQKKVFKMKELYIDIGSSSDKETEKAGVEVGDIITRDGSVEELLGSRMTGPGFDNRLGCFALVEIMKKLKGFKGTVYGVGTVQEETGLVGVRGSAFGIEPDVLIAVDTTIGGGTPELKPCEAPVVLGKGPSLVLKDYASFVNPRVEEWIKDASKRSRVNIQREVTTGGTTDSAMGPMIREGIPSGSIGIPTRYLHTPVEVADIKDVDATVRLMVEALKGAHRFF